MKTVVLGDGTALPAIGMGCWLMGEDPARRADEIASLRRGLDLGLTVIDTAEMYGEGASERLVGEAIAGRRDEVFLVSKVYPHNASRTGTAAACERSLKRLKTDRLDLYLLHWRGSVPLAETVEAMDRLVADGKIRRWGVSNLDPPDMVDLFAVPGGDRVAVNQILYNPSRRGVEWDLLPMMAERRIAVMAYSPIEQARLVRHAGFAALARRHGVDPAALAIAWAIRDGNVIAIPKAGRPGHVEINAAAADPELAPELVAAIDGLFPPPTEAMPLEMI